MTALATTVRVESRKLFINDVEFPWYLAEEGPTVEHGTGEGHTIVHLPLVLISGSDVRGVPAATSDGVHITQQQFDRLMTALAIKEPDNTEWVGVHP